MVHGLWVDGFMKVRGLHMLGFRVQRFWFEGPGFRVSGSVIDFRDGRVEEAVCVRLYAGRCVIHKPTRPSTGGMDSVPIMHSTRHLPEMEQWSRAVAPVSSRGGLVLAWLA